MHSQGQTSVKLQSRDACRIQPRALERKAPVRRHWGTPINGGPIPSWEAGSHASGEATPSEDHFGVGEESHDVAPSLATRDGREGESPSLPPSGGRPGRRLQRFRSKLSRRGVVHAAGGLALASTVTSPLGVGHQFFLQEQKRLNGSGPCRDIGVHG